MRDHLPATDVRELTAIFLGGTLGALGRVGLAQAFPHPVAAWPWPTFATLQLELLRMLDAGALLRALLYAVASLAGGLLFVKLGITLGAGGRPDERSRPA